MKKTYSGCFALSLKGRDKGTIYVVSAEDGDFVHLINGKQRKVSKPKIKRKKHIMCFFDNKLSKYISEDARILDIKCQIFNGCPINPIKACMELLTLVLNDKLRNLVSRDLGEHTDFGDIFGDIRRADLKSMMKLVGVSGKGSRYAEAV